MAIDASDALFQVSLKILIFLLFHCIPLFQVHGTVFDPINSADLCKFFGICARPTCGFTVLSLDPAAGASDDWYQSLGLRDG